MPTDAHALPDLHVGLGVTMRGVGSWWNGGVFSARVVDMRKADDTVKVRYSDGGYKRFPRKQFLQLLVPETETTDLDPAASEWWEKTFTPDHPEVKASTAAEASIDDLTAKLREAVREGRFDEAHNLKKKLATVQEQFQQDSALRAKLAAALRQENYLEAHKLKQELQKLGGLSPTAAQQPPIGDTLQKAARRAFGGGLSGAAAMTIQVVSLMWMRTTMNYQYRYGHGTLAAMKILYKEGGIPRFYRGLVPALLQGPLSRFGDTAANVGALAILNASPQTASLPVAVKTVFASLTAATFRCFLTPVDTVKTILQVEGKKGLATLGAKLKAGGPTVLFHGALGSAAATFAGHYPWFAMYNTLDASLPKFENDRIKKLLRNAGIGFCSSAVSDTVSNSLRVLKTYRQTSASTVSYLQSAKTIIASDGLVGLFGRGLATRIMANGMQGMMFSVLWKHFQTVFERRSAAAPKLEGSGAAVAGAKG